jgi:hypothetical protein
VFRSEFPISSKANQLLPIGPPQKNIDLTLGKAGLRRSRGHTAPDSVLAEVFVLKE